MNHWGSPWNKIWDESKGMDRLRVIHVLAEAFLSHVVPAQPLLLLLDGHSSHFELSSIQSAKKEGIIILCLLPHTTHESQSLDCGAFGPLKKLDSGFS